jgi:hypothetical protein
MSDIENRVCAKIQERAVLGLQKYGVSLERTDLSELDWLIHLSEELMDGAGYIEVLIKKKENILSNISLRKYLMEHLLYDPDTGMFIWIKAPMGSIKVGTIAGTVTRNGYLRLVLQNKHYSMHRMVFLYMEGYIPELVDHINGNVRDNSWKNLREATKSTNACNRGIPISNTSGIKGVSFDKSNNKWRAQLQFEGKSINIGRFKTKVEAEAAIKAKRDLIHGEFSNHG